MRLLYSFWLLCVILIPVDGNRCGYSQWEYFPLEGVDEELLPKIERSESSIHVLGAPLVSFDECPLPKLESSTKKVLAGVYRMLLTGHYLRDKVYRLEIYEDGSAMIFTKQMRSISRKLGIYSSQVNTVSSDQLSLFLEKIEKLDLDQIDDDGGIPSGVDGLWISLEKYKEGKFDYYSRWYSRLPTEHEILLVFDDVVKNE